MLFSLISIYRPQSGIKTAVMGIRPLLLLLALLSLQRQRSATLQNGSTIDQGFVQQAQATAATLALAQKMPNFGFDNLVAD